MPLEDTTTYLAVTEIHCFKNWYHTDKWYGIFTIKELVVHMDSKPWFQ